jgi:hypothetical protein
VQPVADKRWVRQFIAECCEVTKQPHDWIDLKTRPAPPNGDLKFGIETVLRWWCRKHGRLMPDLTSRDFVTRLPPGVYFRDNVRVRQVHGLKFVDQQDPDDIEFLACCSLHRSWYALDAPPTLSTLWARLTTGCAVRVWCVCCGRYIFESLSVLVHVVVMLLAPMLVVCLLAALMNHQWVRRRLRVGRVRLPRHCVAPPPRVGRVSLPGTASCLRLWLTVAWPRLASAGARDGAVQWHRPRQPTVAMGGSRAADCAGR